MHMASPDLSHRQQCLQHTQCMMYSHSQKPSQPNKVHTASKDRHPSQPAQGHRLHSWTIQRMSSGQQDTLMHRCHRVSKGPSRCHEIQMDRSYSSTTPKERSSLHHMTRMLYWHPHRRRTHQTHKQCTMSRQYQHSVPMCIHCTQSRHQSPGQPDQLHTKYSL